MEVSFEILIVLNTAILFTIAYLLSKDRKPRLIFGVITWLCWLSLGVGFIGTNPTYPAYAILFLGISIIFVLAVVFDTVELLREKRYGKTEL